MSENKTDVAKIDINDEEYNKVKKMQEKREGLNHPSKEEAALINQIEEPREVLKKSTAYIKKNINIVMKVAEHLYKVHSNRLFRLKYNSFKEYVNEEFNYTRGRAYQLATAHEIAVYINSKVETDEPVVTTEPQCRELQKIKIYKGDEHQSVDNIKSNEERLKMVNEILQVHKKITTKLIEDKVRAKLAEQNKLPDDVAPADRYDKSIDAVCNNIDKMMENIVEQSDLTSDDKSAIANKLKQKLQQILDSLDK